MSRRAREVWLLLLPSAVMPTHSIEHTTVAMRHAWTTRCRIVLVALVALELLASCSKSKKREPNAESKAGIKLVPYVPPDTHAQVRAGAASQLVSTATEYARRPLGFVNPRLSSLFMGCSDMSGHMDPLSDTCPGTMILTFEDEPRVEEVAYVVIGRNGILGRRSEREGTVTTTPAQCTVEQFLGIARRAKVHWSAGDPFYVGYGPGPSGPEWTVRREDKIVFSLADVSCAESASR